MVPRNPTGSGQQRGCETTGGFPEWRLGVRGVQSQLKSSLFQAGRSSAWMLWVQVGTGECGPMETLTQRPSSPLPAIECGEDQHLWKAPAQTPGIQQGPSFKVRQKAGPQPALDEKKGSLFRGYWAGVCGCCEAPQDKREMHLTNLTIRAPSQK